MREGMVIGKLGKQDEFLSVLAKDFANQQVVLNALIKYLTKKRGLLKKALVDKEVLDEMIKAEYKNFLSQVEAAKVKSKLAL